jgi:tetratricopeptide (TPR) repeat protein
LFEQSPCLEIWFRELGDIVPESDLVQETPFGREKIMFRKGLLCALVWACVGVAWGDVASPESATKSRTPAEIVESFLASLQADTTFSTELRDKAIAAVQTLKAEEDGLPLAISQGLAELYPAFREGITALGEENLPVAAASLQKLVTHRDPWLAAEAAYFLARVHLLEERYEESLPLLETLESKYAAQTSHLGDALFLKGVALGQMLRRADAVAALEAFLKNHPQAPERMRVGAWRQLEQLKMIADGTLSDVQFRMDFSRRRLALHDSGNEVRQEQEKIVSLLNQLIKEAEEKECNCKGSGQGQGKQKKQGKAGESESQGEPQKGENQGGNSGGGSKGTDGDVVERLQRGGPQSPWSELRDRDRDPVFNAIKEKFPGRYQQLIEQYYKSFDEDAEG